jgi:flagellar biosynthesis GTPase FlhF
MLRYTLTISTLCTIVVAAHESARGQLTPQVEQRESQERAERERRAQAGQQRDAQERLEQQQRVQALTEQQREMQERAERKRRAQTEAEQHREAREQAERQRRILAETEHERQMQLQQEQQGQQQIEQPANSLQAEPPEHVAQPELPTRPDRVLYPALLTMVGSCLLAGVSLFMLGRIIRQRFTHR